MDRNYPLIIAVWFMALGFIATMLSSFWPPLFEISIGWETATFFYTIVMQDGVRSWFRGIREWYTLKKKLRLKRREEKRNNYYKED